MLRENKYDLIILDLALPDGSGDELLPLLGKSEAPATPVIIFSASETSDNVGKQIEASLVKSQTTNEKLLLAIRTAIDTGQKVANSL